MNFVISARNYWLTITEAARRMHEEAVNWGVNNSTFQTGSPPAPHPGSAVSLPAPPVNLTTEGGDRSVILRWSNPANPGITGYQFRVQVRALSRAGTGEPGETLAAPAVPPDEGPPAPPALPGAVAGGNGRISLTWSYPNDAAITGYQFRLRALSEREWRPWKDIEGSGTQTVSHELKGLSQGVWYSVQLRALYADGSSRLVGALAGTGQ